MKRVLVPIAEGTEELEAVSIVDVLRRAGAEVTVASVMERLQVTASRGVKLVADARIGDCAAETYDLIALPGGMPGAVHLRDSAELTALLQAQATAGRLYAAICAAPVVVLQHHGLLEGRRATCHPSFEKELRNPEAVAQRVVVDGNCVTSRGPGTAVEFALQLTALLFGEAKAREVGAAMLVR
ncbi:MAG TPA: DJ-1/PfpI family protein [Anaerolineae bacterium]|nr:DJ-1/PfpI family protein [Anaerolineae bacterium]HXK41996.1 DJ-1/PfpI family protein [Anaerolineae bacterium]